MKILFLILLVLGAGYLWTWWVLAAALVLLGILLISGYLFIRVMGGPLTYNGLFPKE